MGPARNPIPPVTPESSSPPRRLQPGVGETLQRLLQPSEKDYTTILELLDALGCSSVGDLAFLQESDFDASSVPPMQQRKLFTIGEFVGRGGKVEEVADLGQLVQQVQSLRRLQEPPIPTPPTQSPTAQLDDEDKDDDEIVKLDVGGFLFKTTRKTLTSVPGSFFDSMFSGRHENPCSRMEDGTYFIDRDGTNFDHVLNFLRHRDVVSLPRDKTEQETLAAEADFYGLDQLVHAITMPKTDIMACLSQEMVKIWDDEEKLRTTYRTKKPEDYAPQYEGLVPLFSVDDRVHSLPLNYDPPEITESVPLIMNIHGKKLKKKQAVTVESLNDFRSNFNREHANVLHRLSDVLLEELVIIAGGSVLRALTVGDELRPSSWWKGKSDVDIFLHAASAQEASRISRRIFYALAAEHERWVIVRSRGVITMHTWADRPWRMELGEKIQIVLRLFESPAEVLLGFDVDCCCCAYDGREVWVTPRFLHAIRSGTNVLNPLHAWPNRPSYELRLAKYGARGFAVAVPGLDNKRIDSERIRLQTLDKLKGLARLLKVSFTMEKDAAKKVPDAPLHNADLKQHAVEEMDDCDLLVSGRDDNYDGGIEGVIVPRVYGRGTPHGFNWQDRDSSDFPLARDIKEGAWSEIENAEEASVERVPDRLENAWDTNKRSREYLNSEGMQKFDLDNQYYDHAYEKTG